MTKQYIKLPGISNQKIRQKYYSSASISHPAKANIPMMHWILKKFVQDGDVVLDPMAGIFTTGIEGMRLFPNSIFIGVELEDKFVKMARANIKSLEARAKIDMFLKIGKAVCVQGDARDLSKILKEKVNKIISSPPFGQAQSDGGIAKKGYDGPKHTPTDMVGKRSYMPENVGGKENIGNLPYGQADKIITSPPYSEIRMDGGGKDRAGMRPYTNETADTWRTQRDQRNIGNLKHGDIDKIISSPPYSEKHEPFISKSYLKIRKETGRNTNRPSQKYVPYSQNQDNIGNLKHGKIDKIVSSPPYSKDVEPHLEMRPGSKKESMRGYIDKVISSPPYEEGIGHGRGKNEELTRSKKIYLKGSDSYSKSKTNIGSLTGKTYLGEMLKVYQECFKVLKARGLMILIVKDFIRQKKRVRLGEDTIKLCQAAGFIFKEIYHRKIEHPSFWRILYQQKHPEVEKIDSEDVLIFEKKN